MTFFFFGTLMDPDVLACVLGRRPAPGDLAGARLTGFRCVRAREAPYPMLVAAPGAAVDGRLMAAPRPDDERRILWFEEDDYAPDWRVVTAVESGRRWRARVFLSTGLLAMGDEPWSFAHWVEREKADYLRQCQLWMRDCPV